MFQKRLKETYLECYFEQGRNNVHIDESLLTNFVTKNTGTHRTSKIRFINCHDYTEVHTIQLRCIRKGWTGHRCRCWDNNPVFTAQDLQVVKRIIGGCVNMRKF